jgi:hypothetical protein
VTGSVYVSGWKGGEAPAVFGGIVRAFRSCSSRNMYSFPNTKCWIKPGSRVIPNYCKSYRKKLHERMCTLSTCPRVMHYLGLGAYQCCSLGVGLLQIGKWGVQRKVFKKTVWKKVKLALSAPWRRRMNRGIAPLILNLDTSWRWGVIFTLRPLYPRGEKSRYALNRRLDGVPTVKYLATFCI